MMWQWTVAQAADGSRGDDTGAWLTLGGAVFVALLAALTAQWRQRVQLRHDRRSTDLAELRALLDECAQRVDHAAAALAHLVTRTMAAESEDLLKLDQAIPDTPLTFDEDRHFTLQQAPTGELGEANDRYYDALQAVTSVYPRAVLRLGYDPPGDACPEVADRGPARCVIAVQGGVRCRSVVDGASSRDGGADRPDAARGVALLRRGAVTRWHQTRVTGARVHAGRQPP